MVCSCRSNQGIKEDIYVGLVVGQDARVIVVVLLVWFRLMINVRDI